MPRPIPPEGFDEILTWLHPDREVAAEMYLELRHDLSKVFAWRGFSDPEELTDEVFDRVARKVHDVRPTYEGDARPYFRAVANNVIKEKRKTLKNSVSLEGIEPPNQQVPESTDEKEELEDCLQSCLGELSVDKRELILAYYAKEKQEKIDHRSALAKSYGMPVETLRVKAFRIRGSLEKCIDRCLKRKAREK